MYQAYQWVLANSQKVVEIVLCSWHLYLSAVPGWWWLTASWERALHYLYSGQVSRLQRRADGAEKEMSRAPGTTVSVCVYMCVCVCVRVFVYLPSSLNFRSNLSVWWSSFLPSPTSPSPPPPGIESWRWWQISRKILSNRGTQSINWDKRYTALPCIVSILLIIYSLYYSLSPTYALFGPYITTFPPSLLPLYICIRNGN